MTKLVLKSIFTISVVAFILLTSFDLLVNADDVKETEGMGFTYSNVIPENQIRKGGFFDLLVEPGRKQTLVTEIHNKSQQKITVLIAINDAKTTPAGEIEYGQSTLRNVSEMTYKLTDMLKGPTEVTIEEGESQKVELQLEVPNDKVEGRILGGIELQKKEEGQESHRGNSIKNEYSYVFSVSLRQTKKEGLYKVSGGGGTYSKEKETGQVEIDVNNDSQDIVSDMVVSTIITSAESNEILAESTLKDVKMAPKSVLAYPIDFPNKVPGRYVTKVSVKAKDESWSWEVPFEIVEAEKIKTKLYPEGQEKSKKSNLFIIVLVTILMSTIVIFLIVRKI